MSSQVYSHCCRIPSSKEFFCKRVEFCKIIWIKEISAVFSNTLSIAALHFYVIFGYQTNYWGISLVKLDQSSPALHIRHSRWFIWAVSRSETTSKRQSLQHFNFFFHTIYTTKLSRLITLLTRLFNDGLEDREYQEPMLAENRREP